MFIFRINPVFLYAGDVGGGDGGGQAATDPGGQPPTGGQVDPGATDQAANEQFWGMFPDVPRDQRLMLEPHLKNVQGHVTRLEQQYAPFKSLVDSGLDAPTLQGLAGFSQRFEQDPLGTWLEMGAALQDPQRNNGNPVVHDQIDFEILAKLARGEDIQDEPSLDQQQQVPNGQPQDQQTQQLMGVIQQLQQEIGDLKGQYTQDKTQAQQRAQDQFLAKQMGNIRTALEAEGFPKDKLSDETIRAYIIAANGNVQMAQQQLTDLKTAILSGGIQPAPKPGDLQVRNGGPRPPAQPNNGRTPKDAFAAARGGAEDFLKRANRDAAQNG